MELKWYQTIETLSSADICTMMILIEKHTDIDAYTVEWMYPLAFSVKANSYDHPPWDEAMNCPHK